MNTLILVGIDLLAISLLTFAVYLPRHRRTELVPAFLGVNIGVLAVSMALLSSSATLGVGLGLFGVLSIIRLRSTELSQREIAYYFASLALGLIGGLSGSTPILGGGLMGLIMLALVVGDHPRVSGPRVGLTHLQVVLDHAVPDEASLRSRLENLLGVTVVVATVVKLDLINDSTVVDVGVLADRAAPVPTPIDERVSEVAR